MKSLDKERKWMAILFAVGLIFGSLPMILFAADNLPTGPIPIADLVENAKKEKSVTLYFSSIQWEGAGILEGFKKKYPFIETDLYRNPSYKVWEKYKAEIRGGKRIADVMFCGGAAMVENVQYMSPYVSSEHKYFEHKDTGNRWVAVRPFTTSMMVNRDLIREADWPKDWLDWIDPKPAWKGKVCTGDPKTLSYTYNTLYGLYTTLGSETFKKILAGLKKCQPKVVFGVAMATEATISGEAPIAFDMLQDRWVAYAVEKKAPLEWIYPASGVVVYNMVAGVLKEAAHPYAARLLLTYMLSDDGQKVMSNMGYYPWSKNVSPAPYLRPLDKIKIIKVFNEVEAEAQRATLIKLWDSYFEK